MGDENEPKLKKPRKGAGPGAHKPAKTKPGVRDEFEEMTPMIVDNERKRLCNVNINVSIFHFTFIFQFSFPIHFHILHFDCR